MLGLSCTRPSRRALEREQRAACCCAPGAVEPAAAGSHVSVRTKPPGPGGLDDARAGRAPRREHAGGAGHPVLGPARAARSSAVLPVPFRPLKGWILGFDKTQLPNPRTSERTPMSGDLVPVPVPAEAVGAHQ